MALPKVETPTYELTLPSVDEVLSYRPFLVREEKILLMAMEDKSNMKNAIKEICEACTFGKWDVLSAPMFDVEYVFLNIRAKSVGEVQKLKLLCPDDKKTYQTVEVNLEDVNVEVDDNHTNKVVIDEDKQLGVVFKYPTLKDMDNKIVEGAGSDINIEGVLRMIVKSVDHIFEGDKIYPAKEATEKELNNFFEDLKQEDFKKIRVFFETMPKLRHVVEVENPNTKVKSEVVISGIKDFFS
tara:strand:+ start:361 stop:1080 length:720 start_codon:yes stop_codon:yes gene_type:complete